MVNRALWIARTSSAESLTSRRQLPGGNPAGCSLIGVAQITRAVSAGGRREQGARRSRQVPMTLTPAPAGERFRLAWPPAQTRCALLPG